MRLSLFFALWLGFFAAQATPLKVMPNFKLGLMTVDSISSEGSMRAAVVLRGEQTRYLRIDCIDRADDPQGNRATNTLLVIDGQQKIGERNHQVFTGVNDFYCQGISDNLFANLIVGDKVEVSIKVDFKKDDYRGGTETADITLINVTVSGEALKRPGVQADRSYDLTKGGQTTGFFTSMEMLH